jgi:hypothetical protein
VRASSRSLSLSVSVSFLGGVLGLGLGFRMAMFEKSRCVMDAGIGVGFVGL